MMKSKLLKKSLIASIVVFGLAACGSDNTSGNINQPNPVLTPLPSEDVDYQALLEQVVEAGLPGIVLAMDSPEFNFIGAAGVSDIDTQTPMQTYDQMPTGSSGKKATALLVAMLHEEGLLNMDDSISTWLSDETLSRIENGQQMTLRQLLNHTAGVYNYLDDDTSDDWYEALQNDPLSTKTDVFALQFALDRGAYFSPGEGFYYSNTGYLLAGLILDQVLGEHHHLAMRERLFINLGMNNTYYNGLEKDRGSIVSGYIELDGELENTKILYENIGVADAPLVSTVEDLSLLLRAIVSPDSTLSRDVRDHLFADQHLIEFGDNNFYGMGIFYQQLNGKDVYHHGGGEPGYLTENYYIEDDDLSFTVFINCNGYASCQQTAATFVNTVLSSVLTD